MSARRSILFVTTLASFLTPFMGSAINIALPAMGKDLDMDTIGLGWVTTSYLLSAAVFLLPFGRLSDKFGRKKIFMLGMVFFAITAFASALAGSELVLIISRFMNGAGGAMIYATAIAILTSSFPSDSLNGTRTAIAMVFWNETQIAVSDRDRFTSSKTIQPGRRLFFSCFGSEPLSDIESAPNTTWLMRS